MKRNSSTRFSEFLALLQGCKQGNSTGNNTINSAYYNQNKIISTRNQSLHSNAHINNFSIGSANNNNNQILKNIQN